MPKRLVHHKGFTLVELLVVIAIIGVVMGAVYSLYLSNQRAAYTQDEVSDMQQNLRLAMDSLSRDIRIAGLLVDYQGDPNSGTAGADPALGIRVSSTGVTTVSNPAVFPIEAASSTNNTGLNASDTVTLNMASAVGVYGRIVGYSVSGSDGRLDLMPKRSAAGNTGDVDYFSVGDIVRVIRPLNNNQPNSESTFRVKTVVPQTAGLFPDVGAGITNTSDYPRIVIEPESPFTIPAAGALQSGDIVVKVNANLTTVKPSPNTIQYALVSYAASPSTATTDPGCPQNHIAANNVYCLARRLNGETDVAKGNGPAWQIIAQNIQNFQVVYVNEDKSNMANIRDIRSDASSRYTKALIVTLTGATISTRALSGSKNRQLSSFIKLINRRETPENL